MAEESEHRARRRRGEGKRDQRVVVKLSLAELTAARTAAEKEGLAVTAWIGNVVEAAADPALPMADHRATRAEVDAVAQATHQMTKVGYLLNQVVAKFHSVGEPPEELVQITRLTWQKVVRLDDEVTALRHKRR